MVTNAGQVVAALAGGALIAIVAVLAIRQLATDCRAEQQRRIDTAVHAIVGGVEAFRRAKPPTEEEPFELPDEAAEVHAKAHLRLIISTHPPQLPDKEPGTRGAPRSRPVRRR